MKKVIILLSVFVLGAYLLWVALFSSQREEIINKYLNSSPHKKESSTNPKQNKITSLKEMTKKRALAQALTFCPELEKVIKTKDKISGTHPFAHNIHFKKENAVHRIRIFTEDGDKGSFEKLIYFIEDQDGFPRIEQLNSKKSINPSEDYIRSLLQGTQTIYDSLDITYYLSSGKSFNASYENGKLTKITAAQVNCQI